jgi:hypothetical protein
VGERTQGPFSTVNSRTTLVHVRITAKALPRFILAPATRATSRSHISIAPSLSCYAKHTKLACRYRPGASREDADLQVSCASSRSRRASDSQRLLLMHLMVHVVRSSELLLHLPPVSLLRNTPSLTGEFAGLFESAYLVVIIVRDAAISPRGIPVDRYVYAASALAWQDRQRSGYVTRSATCQGAWKGTPGGAHHFVALARLQCEGPAMTQRRVGTCGVAL